jgi:hypothetical protein
VSLLHARIQGIVWSNGIPSLGSCCTTLLCTKPNYALKRMPDRMVRFSECATGAA